MFPFPPGHLLAAWLGYALEPPGVVAARVVYAAFSVGASLGIYLLGRKVMPAQFALWGALLLAIAAPRSHLWHLLFGYRYALFAILALLAFSRRANGHGAHWMFVAGLCAGVGLVFRLTPAATASVAIAVGLLLADPRPKIWLRDGALYAAGLLVAALPVGLWLVSRVGVDSLWLEVVLRPVAMTQEQSLPIPDLAALPGFGRRAITRWFIALQFRLWALLYIGYLLVAGRIAWRALRDRAASQHAVFVAIVVWGAVFFFRALGRSDGPHLDSGLPPVCLLLAHLFFSITRRWGSESGRAEAPPQWHASISRRPRLLAAAVALFAVWVFLGGSDYYMLREQRGRVPLQAMSGEVAISRAIVAQALDWSAYAILTWSRPGDTVLDLTASPLLHVLSGRNGIAFSDPLIPGSFFSDEEELRYVEALERRPPAVVLRPETPFDRDPERAIEKSAPRVAAWVDANYRVREVRSGIIVLVPAGS
jgi:hypothetical protein